MTPPVEIRNNTSVVVVFCFFGGLGGVSPPTPATVTREGERIANAGGAAATRLSPGGKRQREAAAPSGREADPAPRYPPEERQGEKAARLVKKRPTKPGNPSSPQTAEEGLHEAE